MWCCDICLCCETTWRRLTEWVSISETRSRRQAHWTGLRANTADFHPHLRPSATAGSVDPCHPLTAPPSAASFSVRGDCHHPQHDLISLSHKKFRLLLSLWNESLFLNMWVISSTCWHKFDWWSYWYKQSMSSSCVHNFSINLYKYETDNRYILSRSQIIDIQCTVHSCYVSISVTQAVMIKHYQRLLRSGQ